MSAMARANAADSGESAILRMKLPSIFGYSTSSEHR
jgi:hypothetical protein